MKLTKLLLVLLLLLMKTSLFAEEMTSSRNELCRLLKSDIPSAGCDGLSIYIQDMIKNYGDDSALWKPSAGAAKSFLNEEFCVETRSFKNCGGLEELIPDLAAKTEIPKQIAEACKHFALDEKNDDALRTYCIRLASVGDPKDCMWLTGVLALPQDDWGQLLREAFKAMKDDSCIRSALPAAVLVIYGGSNHHTQSEAAAFYWKHHEFLDQESREALFFVASQSCSAWAIKLVTKDSKSKSVESGIAAMCQAMPK